MFGASIRAWLRNALDPGAAFLCPVCGRTTGFTGFTKNPRESGKCSSCKSFNRQRQMAFCIRSSLGLPMQGAFRFEPGYSIFNLESTGALHRALCEHGGYVYSEFFGPQFAPGQRVRGVRDEDFQRLSFADHAFDLVLSSDVLEHVPEPYLAHRQILRVLKPGGRHIFTVPYDPTAENDDVRARIVSGKIEYFAPMLYHDDPIRPEKGALVWTIFGRQMLGELQDIGFFVEAKTIHEPQLGIVGEGMIVFQATKPAAV
jgi:SAM-dependent methyltransferase